MKHIGLRSLLLVAIAAVPFHSALADFRVHEWGTFTSLVGSNGLTQHGMYHEDEELPDFVHGFGDVLTPPPAPQPRPQPEQPPRCRGKCFSSDFIENNLITQKMETPVIYFYSDQTRSVGVNVRFPEGAVGQTYPAPVSTFPDRNSAPVLANGNTTFKVDVLSPQESRSQLSRIPYVDPQNIYGHARAVNSNLVWAQNEVEKFIFYRGLGRYQPNMEITSQKGKLFLKAKHFEGSLCDGCSDVPAAFLVHVDERGHGQMLELGTLFANKPLSINSRRIDHLKNHAVARPDILSGDAAREKLVSGLTEAGLYRDEAIAMVKTWEHGYLQTPGLRLLYIMPKDDVEATLPLKVTPTPDELNRVFVARIEVLLDTEEQQLVDDVLRKGYYFRVSSLGRFAEPILRRLHQAYNEYIPGDAGENALFDYLIKQASKAD